jgi:hypothetical protein
MEQSRTNKYTTAIACNLCSRRSATNNQSSGGRAAIVHKIYQSIPARLVRQRTRYSRPKGPKDYGHKPVIQPWFKLFSDYKEVECKDPRDKVFGLHSMASACCKKEILVNYSLSLGEVLWNLIRHQASRHATIPKCVNSENPGSTVKEVQQMNGGLAEISRNDEVEFPTERLSHN